MFSVEWFFCTDGITPNSGLTGPKNTIYIYIYIYIYIIQTNVFYSITEKYSLECVFVYNFIFLFTLQYVEFLPMVPTL